MCPAGKHAGGGGAQQRTAMSSPRQRVSRQDARQSEGEAPARTLSAVKVATFGRLFALQRSQAASLSAPGLQVCVPADALESNGACRTPLLGHPIRARACYTPAAMRQEECWRAGDDQSLSMCRRVTFL